MCVRRAVLQPFPFHRMQGGVADVSHVRPAHTCAALRSDMLQLVIQLAAGLIGATVVVIDPALNFDAVLKVLRDESVRALFLSSRIDGQNRIAQVPQVFAEELGPFNCACQLQRSTRLLRTMLSRPVRARRPYTRAATYPGAARALQTSGGTSRSRASGCAPSSTLCRPGATRWMASSTCLTCPCTARVRTVAMR